MTAYKLTKSGALPMLEVCIVVTVPYGDYPGGLAVVTEMLPDPKAPGIVFQVMHPTYGSIGVFRHEPVRFATRSELQATKTK